MFANSSILTALRAVKNTLNFSLKTKYNIDKEEITDSLLKIHGLHKDNFDFINNIENLIETVNINDSSIDDNSNKTDKTIESIHQEVFNPIKKIIGFRYLYRELKKLYGKNEAKRLSGELYDLSLAIADSTNIARPYCYSFDFSKLVLLGRDFGQLKSKPCKRIGSYTSALCETIHQLSSVLAGAVAIGSYFLDICHLLIYKENYSLTEIKTNNELRKYVENEMQQLVHSLNHLSRNSSECVTEDTEVLTVDGFKGIDTLKVNDEIYTWNKGIMEIQKVDRINISNYDGEMHLYSGRNISQQVTPNHKVLKKIFNSTDYILEESSNLINMKTNITIPVAFKENNYPDYDISDDMLKLLIIILTDGSVHNGQVTIYKSNRRFGNELIVELLDKLNIKYSKTYKESKFTVTSDKYKDNLYGVNVYTLLRGEGKDILNLLNSNKKILPNFFLKLSKRQANIVIDIWKKFDGFCETSNYDSIKLQVDNLDIANQLQHLLVLAGYGSRIVSYFIGVNKNPTLYVLPYKRQNKDFTKKEKIYYKGRVWCPTTKNGIVMFRKNGIVFISGNSPFTNMSIFDRVKLKNLLSKENYDWYYNEEIFEKVKPKQNNFFLFNWLFNKKNNKPFDDKLKKDFEKYNKSKTEYIIDYIMELQEIFLQFFDKGDPLSNGLPYRFPIITNNLSKKKVNDKYILEDKDFLNSLCKKDIFRYNIFCSEGTKLASCCRLLSDAEMFDLSSQVNSFGGGSLISVGSHRVVTVNFYRIALECKDINDFYVILKNRILDSIKILKAHKILLKDLTTKGLQNFIKQGWINLDRMFSTVGILGIVESEKLLKSKFKDLMDNDIIKDMLILLNSECQRLSKEFGLYVNIEQIPGESFAVRLCKADKAIYGEEYVPYTLYTNQFVPLWEDTTIYEKFEIDGKYNKLITGGGIVHYTIGEKITTKQAEKVINYAVESGCEHFALNSIYSICENEHTTFGKNENCSLCGGKIVDYMTRVVGFFTRVSSWNEVRREWEFPRRKVNGV